ncbi:hypothetical protein FlaCF_2905 [Flavobacterium tructae]
MTKLIRIFSVLLIIFSLGMIILFGASGHKFDLHKHDNQVYLLLIFLYLSSAIILFFSLYQKSLIIKRIVVILLFLILLSFLYIFYEIVSITIGDFSAIIPIVFGLLIIFMDLKILSILISSNPNSKDL